MPRCKAIAKAPEHESAPIARAKAVAGSVALSEEVSRLDADSWIPRTQSAFRINQVAEFLSCSSNHIYNLVVGGELKVPKENIARAASRPGIMVPRESLVAFCSSRHSTNVILRKAADAELAAGLPQLRKRLTVKEVAEYLRCTDDHIYQLLKRGELTGDNQPKGASRKGLPAIRVHRASVIAFRARRRIKAS